MPETGVIRFGVGPNSPSNFGLQNVAKDNLSFIEFIVAQCSILQYISLVKICKTTKKRKMLNKLKVDRKITDIINKASYMVL